LIERPLQLARGEEQPAKPIAYLRDGGETPYDLIGTTDASLKLVSERVLGVLRKGNFGGWTTFPVRVLLKDRELHGYAGLAVTGRSGPIDDRLSEDVIQPPPVPGGQSGRALRGLCFEPESWDGSDVFTPAGYTGIFVVEAVKDALERAGMTNVDFHRLSEIERGWRSDMGMLGSE
jgi:hypothetical protein